MFNWYEVDYQYRDNQKAAEKHAQQQLLVQEAKAFQQRGQHTKPFFLLIGRALRRILRYPYHVNPDTAMSSGCTEPMMSVNGK